MGKFYSYFCLFLFVNNVSIAENFYIYSYECTRFFQYYENQYKLPVKLLNSIALAESGRYHPIYKKTLPWPWAVNQGGKAYYFESKEEAIAAVANMIESGISNIDVGCMQVNLGYHGANFKNLEHAFDPKSNVDFAANLLAKHYLKYTNWKTAIAAYHSYSQLGINYYKKVLNLWKKEVNYAIDKQEINLQNKSKVELKTTIISTRKSAERLRGDLVVK